MESGTITEWKVKEGEAFAAGDIICLVETDKATVDYEAQDEAVLAKILIPAGSADVPVGTPMMVLIENVEDAAAFKDFSAEAAEGGGGAGDPAPVIAATTPAPAAAPAPVEAEAAPVAAAAVAPAPSGSGARVAASPLAKNRPPPPRCPRSPYPRPLSTPQPLPNHPLPPPPSPLPPSSPQVAAAAVASAPAPSVSVGPPVAGSGFVDFPLSEQAQAIAQSLTVSKQVVPHYYLTVDLKLEKLLAVRASLNEGLSEDEQLSLNDMLLKAAAMASQKVPDVNASWMDTFVRQYNSFDVNVMVGVGDGLVAPVVRDVGGRGLHAISKEVKDLASKAQSGELATQEVGMGTFTVTNLGAYGVKNFAPIVRMPQACSLAIGAAEERVIPNEDPESEEIYQLETMLSATLSCDHRVVDGAVSAQWLAAFRGLVESPLTMLL
eukprot:jgi/Undpi1/9364/HiC_scaffold_26.g11822.m1